MSNLNPKYYDRITRFLYMSKFDLNLKRYEQTCKAINIIRLHKIFKRRIILRLHKSKYLIDR